MAEDHYIPADVIGRFWKKVEKGDGCWRWRGSHTKDGYGTFGNKYGRLAHRFSYLLHYGPIPERTFICHRCDNPACVRPDHLFSGTSSDNMHDASRKGRLQGPKRRRSINPITGRRRRHRLSEAEVVQIIGRLAQGESATSIAKDFPEVRNPGSILNLKYGKTWRHIPRPPMPLYVKGFHK